MIFGRGITDDSMFLDRAISAQKIIDHFRIPVFFSLLRALRDSIGCRDKGRILPICIPAIRWTKIALLHLWRKNEH
jgi:hypothetical protein